MSGTLGLGTPWTRRLFTPGDRRAIEDAIPDGYRINVQAHAGSPKTFDLLAYGPDSTWDAPLLRVNGRRDPVFAAYAMADRLRRGSVTTWRLAEDMTVTVPLGGDAA